MIKWSHQVALFKLFSQSQMYNKRHLYYLCINNNVKQCAENKLTCRYAIKRNDYK